MLAAQRDVTQPPPSLPHQFQSDDKMQPDQMQAAWMTQNFSPNAGDIDNRTESHPRDKRPGDDNDGNRRDGAVVPLLDLPQQDRYDPTSIPEHYA